MKLSRFATWKNKSLAIVIPRRASFGVAFGESTPVVLTIGSRVLINRTLKSPVRIRTDAGRRLGIRFRGLRTARSRALWIYFGPGAGYMNPVSGRRGATFYVALNCVTPVARMDERRRRTVHIPRLFQIGITRNANSVPWVSH